MVEFYYKLTAKIIKKWRKKKNVYALFVYINIYDI